MTAKKSFYIENLGCSKNQVDAETIGTFLVKDGWHWKESPEKAEVIIVNTCGFIGPAKEESINTVLEYRNEFPDKKIVAAGCLAERYKEELSKELTEADAFFGNKDLFLISSLLEPLSEAEENSLYPEELKLEYPERIRTLSFPGSAYVKISEGCSNNCAYCAIPIIRGGLKSRNEEAVVNEIAALIRKGIKEIILIGQDLGNFGKDTGKASFVSLLRKIQNISGEFWIRMLYIHPDHFSLEIVKICKEDPRFLPYFDIPVQHASNRILKKMGRKRTDKEYAELFHYIREEIPHAVLRTTMLLGFPGETEEDLQDVLQFQDTVEFDWLGAFAYSLEEGTRAGEMENQVDHETAEERKAKVEEKQLLITEKRLDSFLGKTLTVIVEEEIKEEDMFITRSYAQAPDVDGFVVVNGEGLVPGEFVRVRITAVNGVDLEAEIDE
ncbi:MAG: 30S ribosomal protein S12 methylthiotransferase RimO [Spirochaetia bacterium]